MGSKTDEHMVDEDRSIGIFFFFSHKSLINNQRYKEEEEEGKELDPLFVCIYNR